MVLPSHLSYGRREPGRIERCGPRVRPTQHPRINFFVGRRDHYRNREVFRIGKASHGRYGLSQAIVVRVMPNVVEATIGLPRIPRGEDDAGSIHEVLDDEVRIL